MSGEPIMPLTPQLNDLKEIKKYKILHHRHTNCGLYDHAKPSIRLSGDQNQKQMRLIILCMMGWMLIPIVGSAQNQTEQLQYLAQKPPGSTPEVFAPDLISKTSESEFGSVFNNDATAFFYGVDSNGRTEIRFTELIGSKWSEPKTLLAHAKYGFNDPFLSPDENRLYFISQRNLAGNGVKRDHDIWYVERVGDSWSEPVNAGPNINSTFNEYYMSFTASGTMYFSSNRVLPKESQRNFDIYASEYVNGEFQEAVPLSESINTHYYEADVFVDPAETYVIFCARRPEGLGRGDLYISFHNTDGSWTKAISMGDKINTAGHELCPFVSQDGKYLFYTSNQDIYWVSANIIDELKEAK